MKREMKLVAVATAAAMLAACASGGAGGGGGFGEPETRPAVRSRCAGLALLQAGCWPFGVLTATDIDWSSALPPEVPPPAPFTSWAEARGADMGVTASGPAMAITYTGRISSFSPIADPFQSDRTVVLKYDAQGSLVYLQWDLGNSDVYANLSGLGHSEIDIEVNPSLVVIPQTPFTSVTASVVGAIANPYVAGWNYQSFAVWNRQQDASGESGFVAANSYGTATPASAVPLGGSATFSGKLGGLYVSPTGEGSIAAGDVTVNADFGARALELVSSNTVITRDVATATPAPGLNLSGTLSYAPSSASFSGTLTSASGTMSGTSHGQFYGPQTEELGGVFVVNSSSTVETFTGGYGAGRLPGSTITATETDPSPAPPPTDLPPLPFTSWAEARGADVGVIASGPAAEITYTGRISSVSASADPFRSDRTVSLKYDAQGNLVGFADLANSDVYANLFGVGHSELDIAVDPSGLVQPQTPFASVTASAVGAIANPYVAGWNYQSFGVWNRHQVTSSEFGFVTANSYGAATPASAVPLGGTASFTGKLGGLYVSPTGEGSIAAGDVTVNADFSARSLSFASSNTVTTRDLGAATPAPGLNLSGTLTYAPGSGSFSGTLTSAGGTMSGASNGQFYGPQAEELGGVFVVKSATTVETLTGAYGAKR